MSAIKLGETPNLSAAVECKVFNKTVSEKTLEKLGTIALGLYLIGNSVDWLDACCQLGMNTSPVRLNNLHRGFIDVENAKKVVADMKKSPAKSQLAEKLRYIQGLMHTRAKEFMNLIILREEICSHAFEEHRQVILRDPNAGGRSDPQAEVYRKKLEEAYWRLGANWAQEAEQKRSAYQEGGGQYWSLQSLQSSGLFDGPSDFYRPSRSQ